jgi:putative oxidoreductase
MGKGSEFIAGIFLLLGLFTRIGSLLMIGNFSYITFFVGEGRFWYQEQHPFMFALFGILFLFTGPGAWSLDGILHAKKVSV